MSQFKKLAIFAAEDREGFRLEAQQSYTAYDQRDRILIKRLSTSQTTAYDILTQWKTDLQPLIQELEIQVAKPAFHRALSTYLLLDKTEAPHAAHNLVSERITKKREQLLAALYPLPCDGKKDNMLFQRQTARQMLTRPGAEIEAFRHRYVTYLLYSEVATLHSIDVIDPYTSWLKRHTTARRIVREQRQTVKTEDNRLCVIEARLAELSTLYDGLVGSITQHGWDLIGLISLRQLYEKRLSLNKPKVDATTRLAIFNEVTASFRSTSLKKLSSATLSQARTTDEEVASLLLRIFELSTTDKNQLLLISKEFRELQLEKEAILNARAHRQKLLQNT
ncbi:MAG TPA: hypothetical protein VFT59_05415 [Candidatus Saccharimonadales bacterium]|nr:hypothetical protein [Candidatus Saccharimonadales bacterium]